MKDIYFSSTLMWNSDLQDIFQMAVSLGAEGIEFWAQHFDEANYDEDEFLDLMQRYPVKILVHSKSWDLNFSSLNSQIRRTSLHEIESSISFASRIHAPEITVHPPRQTLYGDRKFYRDLAYQGLCELYRYGESAGVKISLEIMEKIPKEMVTTDEAVREITGDLYEKLSYTVDVAHCTNEVELSQYLSSIPNISKLHISNRQDKKYHTGLAHGDYSFQKLWPLLKRQNIPMVVEGLDCTNSYDMLKENMEFIENLKECKQCKEEKLRRES